jgi:hypothetical protein
MCRLVFPYSFCLQLQKIVRKITFEFVARNVKIGAFVRMVLTGT